MVRISKREARQIQLLVKKINVLSENMSHRQLARLVEEKSKHFPKGIAKRIQSEILSDHAVQLGPLPLSLDHLPATPNGTEPFQANQCYKEAAIMLLLVSGVVGRVVTYRNMKQAGRYFQSIYPIKSMAKTESAASSKVQLSWHTEHALKSNAPDYLGILCLRNPQDIGTWISKPDLESDFKRFKKVGFTEGESTRSIRMIDGSIRNFRLRYDPLFMRPSTTHAKTVLREVTKRIEDQKTTLQQRPSWISFIPNRTHVHGRESFNAHFNGQDRWLLRCFIRKTG